MSNNKSRQYKPIKSSPQWEQSAGLVQQANAVRGSQSGVLPGRFVFVCCLCIAVVFLCGCASTPQSKKQLWGSYQQAPMNKAYAVAPDGTAGAAWGHATTEEAKDAAFWSCAANAENFGAYCMFVDVNGTATDW